MKRLLSLVLILALPLMFASCANDEEKKTQADPQAAADKVDLAVYSAMEAMGGDMDFTASYNLFEEAVRLDPNNMQAHAGAGAMNILRMPNHPAVAELLQELGLGDLLFKAVPWRAAKIDGGPSPALGVSRLILGNLLSPAETQTDFHDLIDLFLAEIQVSINHFNTVEGHADFEWMLPLPEGFGVDTLEIDVTDIHFAESPLLLVKALLQALKAYNMELASLGNADIIAALSQDSDFMTLTDPTSIASSRTSIDDAADEARNGALLLEAETDDQTNDLVRLLFPGEEFGLWPAMTEGQRDTLENMPAMVDDLMDNPLPVIADFNADSVPDTLVVNLGVLFSDPVQDWKAILPDYTVTACGDSAFAIIWTAATPETWTWHPEELNGFVALPGGPMTSEAMVTMFGLETLFYIGGCP